MLERPKSRSGRPLDPVKQDVAIRKKINITSQNYKKNESVISAIFCVFKLPVQAVVQSIPETRHLPQVGEDKTTRLMDRYRGVFV